MNFARRWSCRIVGLYSKRVIALDFCRFFTRRQAERYARRLDAMEDLSERVTKVEAYYRPWRTSERVICGCYVVVVLAGLVALTLIFVRS